MYFPKIHSIATKDVVAVKDSALLKDTIEILKDSHHRSIVVECENEYHLFSASDLLKITLTNHTLDIALKDIPLQPIPQLYKEVSVIEAMKLVYAGVNYICVVNEDRSLYGLVTSTDIISSIDPETLMENFRIKDYLKKAIDMNFIDKNQSIYNAMEIMNESDADCVIVTDDGKAKGIVTIKDTINFVAKDIDLMLPIDSYCSFPLQTIPENFTIKDAINFINERHFKRVIATNENGDIIGIINQQELISYSYSHWASMMKNYHDELLKLNKMLQDKTDKLQTMATTDMLTKLYNRHMFTELFDKLLQKKKREPNDHLTLALLDIDNFKMVNDTYGHSIGDIVLVNIATLLTNTLRSSDVVARWGGEEIIILLTNTSQDLGYDAMEKLRVAIASLDQGIAGIVTASIGLTEITAKDTLQSATIRADEALYRSKQEGKNRVTLYSS
jgi:diguanylate cyclase (GGDEF)-like protein